LRSVMMLRAYLDAAMAHARFERLEGDEGYYGEIPGLDGLWASATSLDACRDELASALEDWVVAGLQLGHELPSIDDVTLSAPRIA
jgi:predicted RNase H-like HicB family nuclease